MHSVAVTISLDPVTGGGLGIATCELHRAMAQISQTPDAVLGSSVRTEQHSLGPLRTRSFAVSGPSGAYYAPNLWSAVHEEISHCDAVHLHGLYAFPILAGWAAAKRFQRPLIRHAHGMLEPWSLGRSRLKKRIAHLLFENDAFKRTSLWRALSNAEADQIRSAIPTARIAVVPNGIDLEPIRAVHECSERQRTVLFLARLHKKKGLDLLLPAWQKLASTFTEWRLLIAGPDEDGSGKAAQEFVKKAGIRSVEFPGPLSGKAKYEFLKSGALFVLPSYSEGFSMAILEAMACGLPVVCTKDCHFPQVQASGAGWECSADFDSLFEMLHRALSCTDAELRQRGTIARGIVEKNFTWEKQAADLIAACSA